MKAPLPKKKAWIVFAILALVGGGIALAIHGDALIAGLKNLVGFMKEEERMSEFMQSFGPDAPIIFIGIQAAQVVLAPIPGEATGFVGGYFFGTIPGAIYSSIGLMIGSLINFYLGRFMGRRYLKFFVSDNSLERFRNLLKRQGVLVGFLLFLIPGFPKDSLCLIIGLGSMPVVAFLIISTLGRIPGTLLLSIQGASVHEAHYSAFGAVAAVTVLIGVIATLNKQKIYKFLERLK
ncbi:MAG: TVP38/TMEM64 family protein [Desulfatibacillum sp.]|nr:TVP38/TMEM64 family protein [Desulfatibacillum sp.]